MNSLLLLAVRRYRQIQTTSGRIYCKLPCLFSTITIFFVSHYKYLQQPWQDSSFLHFHSPPLALSPSFCSSKLSYLSSQVLRPVLRRREADKGSDTVWILFKFLLFPFATECDLVLQPPVYPFNFVTMPYSDSQRPAGYSQISPEWPFKIVPHYYCHG